MIDEAIPDTELLTLLRVAKECGYRQSEIAEALDTTRPRITQWAKGINRPNKFYRAMFPALIEKFQANPRVKEPKK